jgi:hypothetical protein
MRNHTFPKQSPKQLDRVMMAVAKHRQSYECELRLGERRSGVSSSSRPGQRNAAGWNCSGFTSARCAR